MSKNVVAKKEVQNPMSAREYIRKNEGTRYEAYKDTIGILTIGVGHNCCAQPVPGITRVGDRLTENQVEVLFERDYRRAEEDAHVLLRGAWESLNEVRRAVFIDMVFNMGKRSVSRFIRVIRFTMMARYKEAAMQLMQSRYAQQVPNRAKRNASMLETGMWG